MMASKGKCARLLRPQDQLLQGRTLTRAEDGNRKTKATLISPWGKVQHQREKQADSTGPREHYFVLTRGQYRGQFSYSHSRPLPGSPPPSAPRPPPHCPGGRQFAPGRSQRAREAEAVVRWEAAIWGRTGLSTNTHLGVS